MPRSALFSSTARVEPQSGFRQSQDSGTEYWKFTARTMQIPVFRTWILRLSANLSRKFTRFSAWILTLHALRHWLSVVWILRFRHYAWLKIQPIFSIQRSESWDWQRWNSRLTSRVLRKFWRRDRLVCSFDDVIHLTSEVIDSSAILRPTYSCIPVQPRTAA